MKTVATSRPRLRHGRYVVAMMLGSALAAPAVVPAPAPAAEVEARAIFDLSRYCSACWRNARLDPECWTDCTQEVFSRLLERVAPKDWHELLKSEGDDKRDFLRAIDAVKKRMQRGRRWSPLSEVVADRRELRTRRRAEDRKSMEEAAAEVLSSRQSQVLQLSLDGWSVQDIALKLGVSPERVSDEKYKAVRKLRQRLSSC